MHGEQVYHRGMIDCDLIRSRFMAMRALLDERGRRLVSAAESRAAGFGGVSAVADRSCAQHNRARLPERAGNMRTEPRSGSPQGRWFSRMMPLSGVQQGCHGRQPGIPARNVVAGTIAPRWPLLPPRRRGGRTRRRDRMRLSRAMPGPLAFAGAGAQIVALAASMEAIGRPQW
jgi:hypothetical protein